jgi:hypothetical protein
VRPRAAAGTGVVGTRALTVDLAIAGVVFNLARRGKVELVAEFVHGAEELTEVLPIGADAAARAGLLVLGLRRADQEASLAGAVMLAVARGHGAKLVGNDACPRGQRDVVRS